MDFLKKRVQKYQEKKLQESLSKIKFHLETKKQLEQEMRNSSEQEKYKLKDQIGYHTKMINIWENNAKKIRKEIKKVE